MASSSSSLILVGTLYANKSGPGPKMSWDSCSFMKSFWRVLKKSKIPIWSAVDVGIAALRGSAVVPVLAVGL